MRTSLHTKTAIRSKVAAALALTTILLALLLAGCELFSTQFIKDHIGSRSEGLPPSAPGPSADEEDFGADVTPDSTIDITSGGTTLYNYLNNIRNKAGNYVINLHGGKTHDFNGNIELGNGVNISLRGAAANIVSYAGTYTGGSLFTIGTGAKLSLRGPTFQGKTSNNASVVNVADGAFYLRSGTISGNITSANGGGVYVDGGNFTMSGGTISGNTANGGGGVVVMSSGTFTMSGGSITGNTANVGGGVMMSGGTFTMSGGSITGNTATMSGHSLFKAGGTATYGGAWGGGNILAGTSTSEPLPYDNPPGGIKDPAP